MVTEVVVVYNTITTSLLLQQHWNNENGLRSFLDRGAGFVQYWNSSTYFQAKGNPDLRKDLRTVRPSLVFPTEHNRPLLVNQTQ
jgi:hypothetical protein